MGIYIGNKDTDPVIVEFAGKAQSNQAYLGLTDTYYIWEAKKLALDKDGKIILDTNNSPTFINVYKCRIGVAGWLSKDIKNEKESPLPLKKLSNEVEVEITEEEFLTPLGANSIASFLLGKLIPAIGALVPEWNGKLNLDF